MSPPQSLWTQSHCIECWEDRTDSELLDYGDHRVCLGCKETMVDKMKQGLPIGRGPWKAPKHELVFDKENGLPRVCVKCGEESTHSVPIDLKWARSFSLAKKVSIHLPLCGRHFDIRRRMLMIRIAAIPLTILFFVFGIGTLFSDPITGVVCIGIAISTAVIGDRMRLGSFQPTRIDDRYVDVKTPSRKYAALWPPFVESARDK